jgi:hypothetical protein
MLIGIERKFVFVANTKTASTSIETALAPVSEIAFKGSPQRKHVSLHAAIEAHPEIFAQPGQWPRFFFKFGVMRDPLDWIGSWFRYRKSNEVDSPLPPEMSFAEFWERQDWNFRRADGRPNLQRDKFCGPQGKVLADVIIPYDRLSPMFGFATLLTCAARCRARTCPKSAAPGRSRPNCWTTCAPSMPRITHSGSGSIRSMPGAWHGLPRAGPASRATDSSGRAEWDPAVITRRCRSRRQDPKDS